MSFGGGGFGAFGNSNQQQGSGFGGFGANANANANTSNNNPSGGFGSSGFGANNNAAPNAGGGLFGSAPSGGFGGFGATNQSSTFGAAKPTGFGANTASTSGGLFGTPPATSSGGGFGAFGGANTNTNTNTSGFGANSNSASLFGQNKPSFGSTGTSGGTGGLFGGTSTATGGFANSTPNFGTGNNAPNQGTGGTPFSPTNEKDGSNNVSYQTITFQQPYANFSMEELRLADYNQGRKYGNQNGQAGAFGTSTGFGGFGSTGSATAGFGATNASTGSMFGSNTATSTPFGGTQQPASTGFGGAASGGLFGQNKPAGGGIFGNNPATTTAPQSGSLFGTSGTTGFGNNNAGGFGQTGGLFGQTPNQNQTQPQNQAKPAFGGFGTGTGTTGGFGSTATTGFGQNNTSTGGGGLFGNAPATSSAFGNNQQQKPSAFGGFGQTQPQGQTANQGGGLFGGGGFGANNNQQQQKPGGIFGNSTTGTGGSLFGQNNQQQPQPQPSGGLFGGAGTQPAGGGLFAQKPANPTNSLFSTTTASNNQGTGGSLFGNLNAGNQQQPNQGAPSLFSQNNQPKSLFGNQNSTSTNTGGGLFGNLGQNNANSQANNNSLFGQSAQQQQPGGSSLFGTPQQNPQNQSTSSLMTSLNTNPYGHDQLFANLATPPPHVGPLATPLSHSQKLKKSAILPQYKVNPGTSSRLITPQKRMAGYGFSYSTYGTPGSVSTGSPAGLFGNASLGSGSFGRSLGKSVSMSNLRFAQNAEDSILAPGAFASSNRSYDRSGSMKRLNVDRNLGHIRTPLFTDAGADGPGQGPKKRVSFGPDTSGNGSITNGHAAQENGLTSMTGALVRAEPEAERASAPTAETRPFGQAQTADDERHRAGGRPTGSSAAPEMQQINGTELDSVPEESPPASSSAQLQLDNRRARLSQKDQTVGAYWMTPSSAELKKMPLDQLRSVPNFTVGREGVGKIEFGTVDLRDIPPDQICNGVVILEIRSATVHGPQSPVIKPKVGKGLNVPSTITLENSFPRSQAGRMPVFEKKGTRYDKHIERLARVKDTEFISFDKRTGAWTFRVQHYTTYGLDYDEDDTMDSSMLSALPDSPTPKPRTPMIRGSARTQSSEDVSMMSPEDSEPDDTFDFKKNKVVVPGGFDDAHMSDPEEHASDEPNHTADSFLDERSVGLQAEMSDEGNDIVSEPSESGAIEDRSMAGGFPLAGRTTEPDGHSLMRESARLKSILKTADTACGSHGFRGSTKSQFVIEADWADQLQRTASPTKDRRALRESQAAMMTEHTDSHGPSPTSAKNGGAFATGIDLMNSLFGAESGRKSARGRTQKGLQWPYAKPARASDDLSDMNASDRDFHLSFKPQWGSDGTLIYAASSNAPHVTEGVLVDYGTPFVDGQKDVRLAKLAAPVNLLPSTMDEQKSITTVSTGSDGIPFASVKGDVNFSHFAQRVSLFGAHGVHEQQAWELASILFDELPSANGSLDHADQPEWRRRKERLIEFWGKLVQPSADQQAYKAPSAEEKALAHLSANNVPDACSALVEGSDIRLAAMVAQIGGEGLFRKEVADQIDRWRELDTLSEISEPIRALYGLLAGHTAVCEGKSNAGPENKAVTFQIASRFDFDWRRAFGLRLWYGIMADEPIEAAVALFATHLHADLEDVQPLPWFLDADASTGWDDPTPYKREDLLWGLLKLYAAQRGAAVDVSFASVFNPENVAGNPLDARLSYQLVHLLIGRGRTATGAHRGSDAVAAADALTHTYAAALDSASSPEWLEAARALLHLSDATARQHALLALLDRHAADLDPDTDTPPPSAAFHVSSTNGGAPTSAFAFLASDLQIPRAWLYRAKALHARAVAGDRAAEARWLADAGDWDAAHAVLCAEVAPRAVLARDLDGLRELLGGFVEATASKKGGDGMGVVVAGWNGGGQVYFDFVHLLDLAQSGLLGGTPRRAGKVLGLASPGGARDADDDEREEVLTRLVDALCGLAGEMGSKGLLERAAIWEMGRTMAEAVYRVGDEVVETASILRLPLTEDACLKHTRELGLGYYRAVLAGGR